MYPWMENGNILDYLKKDFEANPVKLVCCTSSTVFVFPASPFSQLEESAAGLQYLHNMALVHGDIRPVRFASH